MTSLAKLIQALHSSAKALGLSEIDLVHSENLLLNREYELAFDTIITQLYEYETEINRELFDLIEAIAKRMEMSESRYSFMKELIRSNLLVPKPIKDKLGEILKCIQLANEHP